MEESDDDVEILIKHCDNIEYDTSDYMSKLVFNQLHSDIVVAVNGRAYNCHKVKSSNRRNID